MEAPVRRFGLAIALSIIAFSSDCLAQFKVLGIDVDCSMAEAIQKFEKAGYTKVDGKDLLLGKYWGRTVLVNLTLDKQRNAVGWVGVWFKSESGSSYRSWSVMKKDIMMLSNKLKDKYKEDITVTFEFTAPYSEGDGREFEAACSEKADLGAAMAPGADGIAFIRVYPSCGSETFDDAFIIMHFFSEKTGTRSLND